MNFAQKLRTELKNDVFGERDLKALLYPLSDAAILSGITRSLKTKDIIKLKRGLYLFSEKLRHNKVSRFSIANNLYDPSYVSFESALSFHGLIPEAVYTTTSACFQLKKKSFSTELGDFSYDYVPCRPFFMGVQHLKTESGMLVASPLKALFDYCYLHRKKYGALIELEKDLRLNLELLEEEVKKESLLHLETLAESYKKKNLTQLAQLILREFK